ncbi:hypothetical protein TrRE_jg5491, partial [Triparma retinervis]
DARNSSNSLRGGGKQSTGGKTRTSKKASTSAAAVLSSAGDEQTRLRQVVHAREQLEGKELARGVMKETVGRVDFKGMGMELPTGVAGTRRIKNEQRRELFYQTRGEFLEVVKAEWVYDINFEWETSQGLKELEGSAEKDYRRSRGEEKKKVKALAIEGEVAKGPLRLEDGRSVAEAEEDKRAAADQAKKAAEAAGLGDVPPEILEAMRIKREKDDEIAAELGRAKRESKEGRCAKCGKEGEGVKITMCGKCRVVGYCGRECQVADWKVHKRGCKVECARAAKE